MADRDGNPIVLGSRYLVVGKALADAGATIQLEIDKQIYEVAADSTLPVSTIIAGAAFAPGASRLGAMFGQDGEPGEDGVQGPAGRDGTAGAIGPSGPPGVDGSQGQPGIDGDDGEPGVQGPAGATGATGNPGATGPQGEAGIEGAQGPAGPAGDPGATGAPGANGAPGATGATGLAGPEGLQGEPGEMGVQGPQGKLGDRGAQGAMWIFDGDSGGESYIVQPATARDPWTYVRLTADYSTSSAGYGISALQFIAFRTRNYEVEAILHVRSASVIVRPIVYMYWPDNLTIGSGMLRFAITNATSVEAYGDDIGGAFGTAGATFWPDTTRSYPCWARCTFTTGSVGDYNFYLLLEPTTAGTNVTFKAGSFLRYREIP